MRESHMDSEDIVSDATPTHTVKIYDTIEWTFDIVAASDEEAENFDQHRDADKIVRQAKRMYYDSSDVFPYNQPRAKSAMFPD
jgi:hypothetical protein